MESREDEMFFNEVIFARSTELKYKFFFASIYTTDAVVFVSLYFILIDVN